MPQLPKRGLTTTGGSIGAIARVAIMCSGPGVRQARCVEHASRLQLVVRGEEGPQPVEDVDAVGLEPADLPDAGLDPVQAGEHVEPGECGITRPEQAERFRRRDDLEVDAGRRRLDEPQVRLVMAVCDEGKVHGPHSVHGIVDWLIFF